MDPHEFNGVHNAKFPARTQPFVVASGGRERPIAWKRHDTHEAAPEFEAESHWSLGLAGAGGLLRALSRGQLTVVCYHRVLRTGDKRFQGYKPNISAMQETFVQQIDFMRAHYNPITLRDLVAWLDGGDPLPPRSLLITFDDGFRDNVYTAWPLLRERGITPAIFLSTGCIEGSQPFIWDVAAFLFAMTPHSQVYVPPIGMIMLETEVQRDAATARWTNAIKRLPGQKREDALCELSAALDVSIPSAETFRHLYMSWAEVHEFARQGVEFGAHTQTHPILASLPPDEAAAEIVGSIEQLSCALGARPLGFAYPNGSARDYTREHERIVEASGVPLAFSLVPGPMPLSRVHMQRMAIHRIYVGRQDNMPRFIAKLTGGARIAHLARSIFVT